MKTLLKTIIMNRVAWTLLLVFILATITVSYQVLAPIADTLEKRLNAYNEFSSRFIVMLGKSPGSLKVNEFYIEKFFREHPEWLGPPDKREEIFVYKVKEIEENLPKWYPFTEDDYKAVQEIPNIESVYRLLNMRAEYPIPNKTKEYYIFYIVGIELKAAENSMLPFGDIENGRFLHQEEDALVINFRINRDFGFNINDKLPLLILLEIRYFPIIGVYSNLLPIYLDPGYTAIANIDTIWRVMDVPIERRRYNGMLVKLEESKRGMEVVDTLQKAYPDVLIFWKHKRTLNTFNILDSLARFHNTMRLILLVASYIIVLSVSLIDIQKRQKELALLDSVGWREKKLFILLFIRSLLIGVISTAVSIPLSYGIGGNIAKVLIPERIAIIFNIFPIIPDPNYLLHAPLVSIGISALAFTTGYFYYRR